MSHEVKSLLPACGPGSGCPACDRARFRQRAADVLLMGAFACLLGLVALPSLELTTGGLGLSHGTIGWLVAGLGAAGLGMGALSRWVLP